MDQQSKEYFNKKWTNVINSMPNGGNYRFDLREHGHNIVCDNINPGKSVFDYACGLGVIDNMLEAKGCTVSGCDISEVAIDYVKKLTDGTFKVGSEFFGGNYDYILALHFLEHIKDPVNWLNSAFKYGKNVIVILPNNFSKHGEHVDMQWSNWDEFYSMFDMFKIKRLDEGKYPNGLNAAFRHPIFIFKKKKGGKKYSN
jgi:hypothetical protein